MPQGTPVECPVCHERLDGFRGITDDDDIQLPEPGCVSLCFYCSSVGIFTEEGLRLPTEAEALEIYADPEIERARTGIRLVKDPDWDGTPQPMRGFMFEHSVADDAWPLVVTITDRESGLQLWRAVAEDFGALRIPTGWPRPVNITMADSKGEVRYLAGP